MNHDPRPLPAVLEPTARARAYVGQAARISATMARYAALGRADGVRNGARALRFLAREIGGAIRGRGGGKSCPVCGWSGERFGPIYYVDEYRENTLCYGCGSTDRARLMPLYCKAKLSGFFTSGRRRVLEVGPLRNSRASIPYDVDYVSFDLNAPHAMVRGDLCAAPFPDASFDLWICFHVLDVIEHDERAMRELYRVLAPGGVGLLDNVMNWSGPTTEYGEARRHEAFHRRRYGTDLLDKLRRIGFDVEVVDIERSLDAETRARHGVHPRRVLSCKRPVAP